MDITSLIRKFLANMATPAEQQRVLDSIEANPGYKGEFENPKSLPSLEIPTQRDTGHAEAFQKIHRQIKAKIRKKKQRRWLLVAAALFVAAAIVFFLFATPASGVLAFENTPLSTVAETIRAEFDVSVQIENKDLLLCSFTGTFYRTTEPVDLIAAVAKATGATYQQMSEKEFMIIGGSCD